MYSSSSSSRDRKWERNVCAGRCPIMDASPVAVSYGKLACGNFSLFVMLNSSGCAQLRNTPASPARYNRISGSLLRSCTQADTEQLSGTTAGHEITHRGDFVSDAIGRMNERFPPRLRLHAAFWEYCCDAAGGWCLIRIPQLAGG